MLHTQNLPSYTIRSCNALLVGFELFFLLRYSKPALLHHTVLQRPAGVFRVGFYLLWLGCTLKTSLLHHLVLQCTAGWFFFITVEFSAVDFI